MTVPVVNDYINDGVMRFTAVINYTEAYDRIASLTFTCEDEDGNAVTLYNEDQQLTPSSSGDATGKTYEKYTPTLPSGTPVVSKTLTVTKDGTTGKWSATLDGLPLTSGGQPVYYYVVERDSTAFTPIDYTKNGFVLEENKASSVTVTNQSQEVDAYELPEAGGEGTTLYIITGSGLMLGAMVLFTVKRRKAESR